jgi:hypothetical protein
VWFAPGIQGTSKPSFSFSEQETTGVGLAEEHLPMGYKRPKKQLGMEDSETGTQLVTPVTVIHSVTNRPRFGCDSRARILQLDRGQLKGLS